jgi:hypothetical protein
VDLQERKTFKVFNQDFIVDERYIVTKELGQGAYGIVWYVHRLACFKTPFSAAYLLPMLTIPPPSQCGNEHADTGRRCNQESNKCLQQEDSGEASTPRDKVATTLQRPSQRMWHGGGAMGFCALCADGTRLLVFTIWIFLAQITSTRRISTKVGILLPLLMRHRLTGKFRAHGMRSRGHYPLRTTPHRRPLPILYLPDPVRFEIYPLSKCPTP